MRVAISGASGLIGTALHKELAARGYEFVPLVRRQALPGEVEWNPAEHLEPGKLSSCDAVVHLSGKNIAGRWTERFKRDVYNSRVESTRTLANAAAESFRRSRKPQMFLSASAIGYYGDRGDELLTESSPPGKAGLSPELVLAWEAATAPASEASLRVANLRFGVVLAAQGGALQKMVPAFRLGLGGQIGNGQQYLSWISLDDVVGTILLTLQNDSLRGAVNIVAPNPVRNAEFTETLGHVLGRPTLLPVPAFLVRLLFGQMGDELLLASQRVEPSKLKAAGYQFRHAELREALRAVLA